MQFEHSKLLCEQCRLMTITPPPGTPGSFVKTRRILAISGTLVDSGQHVVLVNLAPLITFYMPHCKAGNTLDYDDLVFMFPSRRLAESADPYTIEDLQVSGTGEVIVDLLQSNNRRSRYTCQPNWALSADYPRPPVVAAPAMRIQ